MTITAMLDGVLLDYPPDRPGPRTPDGGWAVEHAQVVDDVTHVLARARHTLAEDLSIVGLRPDRFLEVTEAQVDDAIGGAYRLALQQDWPGCAEAAWWLAYTLQGHDTDVLLGSSLIHQEAARIATVPVVLVDELDVDDVDEAILQLVTTMHGEGPA